MDILNIVVIVLGVITSVGATAAYFARSRGKETIELLGKNIEAFKDAEKLKDQRIAYLEGQLVIKDETIKRLLDGSKNT